MIVKIWKKKVTILGASLRINIRIVCTHLNVFLKLKLNLNFWKKKMDKVGLFWSAHHTLKEKVIFMLTHKTVKSKWFHHFSINFTIGILSHKVKKVTAVMIKMTGKCLKYTACNASDLNTFSISCDKFPLPL